jgi:hypothetical protein
MEIPMLRYRDISVSALWKPAAYRGMTYLLCAALQQDKRIMLSVHGLDTGTPQRLKARV